MNEHSCKEEKQDVGYIFVICQHVYLLQMDQNKCNIIAAFLRYFQQSKVIVFIDTVIHNDCMSILNKRT